MAPYAWLQGGAKIVTASIMREDSTTHSFLLLRISTSGTYFWFGDIMNLVALAIVPQVDMPADGEQVFISPATVLIP